MDDESCREKNKPRHALTPRPDTALSRTKTYKDETRAFGLRSLVSALVSHATTQRKVSCVIEIRLLLLRLRFASPVASPRLPFGLRSRPAVPPPPDPIPRRYATRCVLRKFRSSEFALTIAARACATHAPHWPLCHLCSPGSAAAARCLPCRPSHWPPWQRPLVWPGRIRASFASACSCTAAPPPRPSLPPPFSPRRHIRHAAF